MRTVTIPAYEEKRYTYAELGSRAQQKALEQWGESQGETFEGYEGDYIYSEVAKALGFAVDKFYWSGFASQGDGASFVGSWDARDGAKAVEAMRELFGVKENEEPGDYAKVPMDMAASAAMIAARIEAWRLADAEGGKDSDAWQEPNGDENYYTVSQSDRYVHQYTMSAAVSAYASGDAPDLDDDVTELARDFAQWVYRRLEEDYNYRTGEESLKDAEKDGVLEFKEGGKIVWL